VRTERRLIATPAAAEQLGVNDESVRRYYRSGILRGERRGRRILVDGDSVLALAKVMLWVRQGKPKTPHQLRAEHESKRAAEDEPTNDEQILSESDKIKVAFREMQARKDMSVNHPVPEES
jgi:hypothetical protein